MSPEIVGIIGVVILAALLFSRMYVGGSMMLVGFLGCWYLGNLKMALNLLGIVPYSQSASYTLACLPLFVMMGVILSVSKLGEDLYNAAAKWIGNFRGGLAMATEVACGFFAAVCGDSVTTAVTMGTVSFPQMMKRKYSMGLSACCIVSGGTLGILIPPSIGFIFYGLITEQSIGKLFMAGLIPGILQVLFYLITIFIVCRLDPTAGPGGPKAPMSEKVASLKNIWPVLLIFLAIILGLYGGFFTPTEAGAFGAFTSLLMSIILRRMTPERFKDSLRLTLHMTAMVFFLIIGAFVFMRFMALSRLPVTIGDGIANLTDLYHVPRFILLIGILVFYIILGAFLDVFAIIFLTLSIVFPIIVKLNYDPIWFGVIMVRMMEIGMITPPFGLNLFVISKTTNTPIKTVYKGIIPFIFADFVHVGLLILIPEIALFLPNAM